MRPERSNVILIFSGLYYFFIGATMLYWIYILAFQSAEYQLPIMWLPAAASAIPLFVFRKRFQASLILVSGNWLFVLVLFYLYFIQDGGEPDGQAAMGNFILMLFHWIAVFVLFVVALIAALVQKNDHKLR